MNKKIGNFLTQSILENQIILEWEEIAGQTKRLAEKISEISKILIEAYTKTEVNFVRQAPQLVSGDFMLKSLAPFFQNNLEQIHWKLIEEKIKNILEQFFSTTDWIKHSGSKDANFFVLAKDIKTKKNLGVIQFLITSEFEQDNVKAALFGVIHLVKNTELEKLLMSSIFKLKPNTKRIFLHTRSTNQQAIDDYKNWGFTEFPGKIPNWVDLEYLAENSDNLQKLSQSFVLQN